MSLRIKRSWPTVLSGLLLASSLFWRLVGRASDVDFLLDAGAWIGPRAMDFLASWGWLISSALGVVVLYFALRQRSITEPAKEQPAPGQETPKVPETLPGEEKIRTPAEPTPRAFGRPGTGITVHNSPGALLRGNFVENCDHGIDVGCSPEAELWNNLVIGPRRKDAERDRGSKDRRKKDG